MSEQMQNDFVSALLTTGMAMMEEMSERNQEWEKRVRRQFRESMNLPRKKKKKVRKSLNLEYNIILWERDMLVPRF
jgi:hypothetical protein